MFLLKRLIQSFLCLAFGILCVSCSGTIANQTELIRYANENYGKSELINSKKTDSSLICYFTDKEYSFSYWVKSSRQTFSLDGSDFFRFEWKDSNFEEQYYNTIIDMSHAAFDGLEDELYIQIEPILIAEIRSVHNCALLSIVMTNPDPDNIIQACSEISEIFQQLDNRNYFKNGSLRIYDAGDAYLGSYNITSAQYISRQEEEIKRFQLLSLEKDRTSVFQYLEMIPASSFTKLCGVSLNKLESDSSDTVTLYYFKTESGYIYYIADARYNGECYSNFQN